MAEALETTISGGMPHTLDLLKKHVRIPSISADPMHDDDVEESAEFVEELLGANGFPTTEILRLEGAHPAVFASWPGPPGAPTVLLYAHHDVQPVGPAASWNTDPFEPTEDGGRLFGRGAADDKAGIAMHLGSVAAFGGNPPVGLKMLIEGEEEIGSLHLSDFLDAHAGALAADVIVIGDSGNWRAGQPALTTSLRGLVDCTVTVSVVKSELHSGQFGGAVPDALTVLARLIATLHHDDGRVAIEGLVENEADPLDLTEDELRSQAGMIDGVELIGRGTLTSRLWAQPAISILAIDAPRLEEAVNALVAKASAKVSMRIPPGQDPVEALALLRGHLKDHTPWGARIDITDGSIGAPFDLSHPGPATAAMETALESAYGEPVVHMGVGGSIPFVAAFADRFADAEIMLTGVADPSSAIHGPNESVSLNDLERSIVAQARWLRALGDSASPSPTQSPKGD